jgi:hypothetical protein
MQIETGKATPTGITRRYVSPSQDMELIRQLVRNEYSNRISRRYPSTEELEEVYTHIALSDTSQAFMVFSGDEFLFLFEVHNAMKHDIGTLYEVKEGDFCVLLLLSPPGPAGLRPYAEGLRNCLVYSFAHSEVERIIAPLYPAGSSGQLKDSLVDTGFTLYKNRTNILGPDFYLCTRNSFLNVAENLTI